MKITTRAVYDLETGKLLEWEGYEYTGPLALADRSIQAQGKNAVNTANSTAAGYGGGATGIGGTLIPTLTKEATNPTGLAPQDVNNMLVAGEQGSGGANAGIAGEAALHGARTRNAGGFSGALDQAARIRGQQTSQNALNVNNENAQIKLKQQQEGIQGLQGMYGQDVSAQMKALGLVPEDMKQELAAGQQGWLQNTLGVLNTVGNLGKDAADAYKDVQ